VSALRKIASEGATLSRRVLRNLIAAMSSYLTRVLAPGEAGRPG
jgi:hypothetical protein